MYKQKSRSSRRRRQYNSTQDHHNNVPFGFIMRRSWIGSTIIRFRGKFLFIFAVKLYFGSWERKEGERKKIQKEDAAKAWDLYRGINHTIRFYFELVDTQHSTAHHITSQLNVVLFEWIKLFENAQTTGTTTYAFGCSTIMFLVLGIYFCGAAVAICRLSFFNLVCRESLVIDVDCVCVWSCAFFSLAWFCRDEKKIWDRPRSCVFIS